MVIFPGLPCVFTFFFFVLIFSMAHQRSYISMTPDRSRSRDDPPICGVIQIQSDLMTQHIRGPGTILRHYEGQDGF